MLERGSCTDMLNLKESLILSRFLQRITYTVVHALKLYMLNPEFI
jgi:hypothetical protein